jgi:hypothetical protein
VSWSCRLLLAPVLLFLIAGCGMLVGPVREPVPAGETCILIEQDDCRVKIREALAGLGPNHPPVVGVLVRCTKVPCTDAAGEGETIVAYADGSQVTMGWAFAQAVPLPGGAPPPPTPMPVEPQCLGIPRQPCVEFGTSDPSDPTKAGIAIVSIVVRCTSTCDARHGDGKTTFTYADGATLETGWSYESG